TAQRACGDAPAAAAQLGALAVAQPDSAPVQLELGRALAAQGDAERAFAALHAARGDLQACDAAYANFTRLAPPERHLAEAAAALAARRLPAAEALLRERLARAPRDVGALRLLAEV